MGPFGIHLLALPRTCPGNFQFDKLHVAPSRVGTIHVRRISVTVVKFDREARTLPYYPPSPIGKRPPQIKGQAPAGTVSNPGL